MADKGWILINRKIVNHWLWTDAERLKWWLDLLLLANWEDTEVFYDGHKITVHRGEMIASVAFLCKRWERSHPTVIKFLQLLEAENMISRKVLYRQTPILTICNYERYQYNRNEELDTLVYPLVYTNKINNKENINNINIINTKENDTLFSEDFASEKKVTRKIFTKPTIEEVAAYCSERKNGIDAESFVDFYESKGWKVGSSPMKDWKAAVRTWEKSDNRKRNGNGITNSENRYGGRRGYTDYTSTSPDDYSESF